MNSSNYILNENQKRAVWWDKGPLLVLAGPGSGKTLVLTLRAERILRTVPDASVLALTFTTKAADEMRQRLDARIGGRADRARLCTFHSFAGDILRQHGSHIGIQPDFSLLANDGDRLAVLEQAVGSLKCDTSTIPEDRKNLLVLLDRLFGDSYSGNTGAPGVQNSCSWIPSLFNAYCEALRKGNRLDFGGLLYFARMLLSTNVGVARITKLAWQYICVDEFQDTNRAQYDLLALLAAAGTKPNLFVVADEDQIIYQWNGASPERLQTLRSSFGMEVIQLPENFRCPPVIIQLANNLIAHNQSRSGGKEPLVAQKSDSVSPVLRINRFNNEDEEAENISELIGKSGWKPEECVVIARSTKLLERVARSLRNRGISSYVAKRKTAFESAAVHWMYAMLRLANGRHDRGFLRSACVAWKAFTESLIETEEVEARAVLDGGDFLRAWIACTSSNLISDDQKDLLGRVSSTLGERLAFLELLEWFWTKSWVDDETEKEEIQTWQELHADILREYTPANMTLHLYLQEMDLKSKVAAHSPDSVRCLTVHGSKGLEFKHVFLIGMADEVFPSYHAVKKGSESQEMEEERRSCFVAITRTEETLNISRARTYKGYQKEPSRFLKEMGFKFKRPGD